MATQRTETAAAAGCALGQDPDEASHGFRILADSIPQIVCVLEPDGTPVYVNAGWTAFSGLGLDASLRAGWPGVLHPDDLVAARAFRRRALKRLTPQEAELRFRAADGSYRAFLSRLAPVVERGRVVRFIGAAMDIEERLRAERDLRQREEDARRRAVELREADRRKDEFLAMLGHELRNPLAPIRNAAYLLEHADPNGPEAKRARAVLRRQTEHLTRLVDDLLDVNRVARGKIALQRARTSLRDVVLRAADDIRPAMIEKGIAFRVEVPAADVWAHADATRLNQVVANLLHNASKFTREGDEVVVSLRVESGTAEIRVRDTGAGIDPAALPRIFDAFVQADRTVARSEGGLGLGLALVKGIVELHGGEVRAESAGIGRGTELLVRLPLRETADAAATSGTSIPALKGGRRVLVVDDNTDAAEVLADVLRMLGHTVDVASDGPTALAKLASGSPEVVLCDIGLAGMSGYEVATAMRANCGRELKLVAVTGYAQPDDVRRAREAGFDAHVAKPADPVELARLLAS